MSESLLVPDVVIPAMYMYPGRTFALRLAGKISNVVTTPGTITLRVRWGGITGTILVASAAIAQNIVAQTDDTWMLDLLIACRTIGATGSFLTSGKFF